jgi:hypothetical protein
MQTSSHSQSFSKPLKKNLVRKDWIQSCEFHPLSDAEVLNHVVQTANQKKGVVLLDLDSTLYEVGPRTLQILREFKESPESREFPKVRDHLDQLSLKNMGYSLHDTFVNLGILKPEAATLDREIQAALKTGYQFWAKRFFTNEYLAFDHAYEGAQSFVRDVYDAGAEIIYLTGRDEPGMGKGTRNRLIEDGFPFDQERTHLLLKENFHLDDLEHKSKATEYVKKFGELVASFENEPPNVVAIHDIFPGSIHVFMDSVYSDRPADTRHGLYRIESFRR